jgi:hypothetical protein
MKKNLLIMGGLVFLFIGFNGCRPYEEQGVVPGRNYKEKDLDPGTKGNTITEDVAKLAIQDYYDNYFIAPPGSANIMFKDYFPEYEVFTIDSLIKFIKKADTTVTKPAYLVVRHGVFKDPTAPNDPTKKRIKTIMYMTDVNNDPVKSPSPDSKILLFEEWRRCPPDCRQGEDVRLIFFPPPPPLEEDNGD